MKRVKRVSQCSSGNVRDLGGNHTGKGKTNNKRSPGHSLFATPRESKPVSNVSDVGLSLTPLFHPASPRNQTTDARMAERPQTIAEFGNKNQSKNSSKVSQTARSYTLTPSCNDSSDPAFFVAG